MDARLRLCLFVVLAGSPLLAGAKEFFRCTAADGSYSYLTHGECKSPTDARSGEEAVKPLVKRDESNTTRLVKCTSRDGQHVSIQRGNCADPDDYQQLLGDP
jgi:hypothetical protein